MAKRPAKSPAKKTSRRKAGPPCSAKPRFATQGEAELPLTGPQRKAYAAWKAAGGVIRQAARRLGRDRSLVKVELRAALGKLGQPTDLQKAQKKLFGKGR